MAGKDQLLLVHGNSNSPRSSWRIKWVPFFLLVSCIAATGGLLCCVDYGRINFGFAGRLSSDDGSDVIVAEHGVVAADDKRCSEIGTAVLKGGGHAADAAVATALCLGVVNPMASGVGGGAFILVRTAADGVAEAFDARETAPAAASEGMYKDNPLAKKIGALSMGIPGEIAGLYQVWKKYGKLPWKNLVLPAVNLARHGFIISKYLDASIKASNKTILSDPGLCSVFAPKGVLLKSGDTCYNHELANTLQAVADEGPKVFYNGSIAESLVKDVQAAGGIVTVEDLQKYKIEVRPPVSFDVMGYKILGMPPPSAGTLGLAFIMNIFASYNGTVLRDAASGSLGLHRFIEALKHMLAMRMYLGDPDFVNITTYVEDMLSPEYAAQIRKKIVDNITFPADYYLPKWSQLDDHGTSHFCIVDADRNSLSMTSTVNYRFGAGVLSPSTGILLNNEMDDFSTPTEMNMDGLPPAPSNFIRPDKRPLSSMTPIIVLKDNQLAGVLGGSGGILITPAVVQVFINHFILSMDAESAVLQPRVYHKLLPNKVLYENWTLIDGDHMELSAEKRSFLKQCGHELKEQAYGAICQLVVHDLQNPIVIKNRIRRSKKDGVMQQVLFGKLTAVSDPRKDGTPDGF